MKDPKGLPNPEKKEPALLTAAEFIEVLRTGKTDKYEAKSKFGYDIIIKDIIVEESICIKEDLVFEKSFIISGGNFKNEFIIRGGNFNEDFWISGGSFENNFRIYGGQFKKDFNIIGVNFKKDFRVSGGNFSKDFCINGANIIQDFCVNGGSFKSEFIVSGGKFNQGFWFNRVNFSKKIVIQKATISDLYLSIVNKARIIASDLKLGSFTLDSFYNENTLSITDVKPLHSDLTIKINNSSLGDTEIIGCDWKNGSLEVDNSKIIDLFYTDTIFPKHVTSSEKEEKARNEQIRDTYSQLKTIADKQNDRPSSLNFQAKSNEYIYRLAKNDFRVWPPLNITWWESTQLALSKWSNNFGISYGRAFGCILGFGILLFGLYAPFISSRLEHSWKFWHWPEGFWYGITHHFGDFFGFLNPAKKVGYMCPENDCENQWALVVDWVSRVLITYLIYQFVQAFRKYGKR